MRLLTCLILLACPVVVWADDETVVEGKQGDRPYPFRSWEATQAEGLALALLASCRDEADKEATKERWEGVLEGSHLRIGYPRLRRLGTAAANKAFSASAILMPIEMGKNGARPKHILVRTKDGYRAFTKYDPEICAALQEVLRKSMP
jgi:hypothetical protein